MTSWRTAIASSLDGKRVVIGSEHFVVEDEGVSLTEEQKRRVADETEGLSPLTWRWTAS